MPRSRPESANADMCQPQMDGLRPSPTRACARAIVDRLTYGGNIIETGTHSYRLAHTRAHQTTPA